MNKTPSSKKITSTIKDTKLFRIVAMLCLSASIVHVNPFYINTIITYFAVTSFAYHYSNVECILRDESEYLYDIVEKIYELIQMKIEKYF